MIVETITVASGALVAYHHAVYPLIMSRLARNDQSSSTLCTDDELPTATVVMPAFNEADHIAQKIANIASLDYPHHKLHLLIGCDGCTDDTVEKAQDAAAKFPDLDIRIWDFETNRGKVAVLNDLVASVETQITVFTDVSAEIAHDAVRGLVSRFQDPQLGAVGGGYVLHGDLNSGGASYWSMQTAIKCGESRLGGLIGAHGALYAIRTESWQPLFHDTINDDFIVPMTIATNGWRTLYDPNWRAFERDAVGEAVEAHRRERIGAGNMQQLLRLIGRCRPENPGLIFCFLSGKALRVLVPLLMFITFSGSLFLAAENPGFLFLSAAQIVAYTAAIAGHIFRKHSVPKPIKLASYLVFGHAASARGALGYLLGCWNGGWKRTALRKRGPAKVRENPDESFLPPSVKIAKRAMDIGGSVALLALTLPLFPLVAMLIKLESRGPVFFRQRRVGRVRADRTELFMMIKFRSMRQDAEKKSGAVWAVKNDPRVTRVGRFLRKTRLDELPQLLNVLKGEMSLVGPRPERPELYGELERKIPFYRERTFGLRPGITGLAQVNQGYDTSIEDVRNKVMYDHAYAASSCRFLDWLQMELSIAARTVGVMSFGRGQ